MDGDSDAFWVEPSDLNDFAFELDTDAVPKMLRLEHFGGSAELYYSTEKVAAVVMPLIDLMDARKESLQTIETTLEIPADRTCTIFAGKRLQKLRSEEPGKVVS